MVYRIFMDDKRAGHDLEYPFPLFSLVSGGFVNLSCNQWFLTSVCHPHV